jgi:hypothetical protein
VGLLGQFPQAPVLEPGRADAVGPQQRGHGDAALSQPAGIFLGGRGGVDIVQVDAVLEDVQHGGHVLGHTCFQQRQDPVVAAQLGDVPHDELVDVHRQLGGVGGKRAGDVGGVLGDGGTCSLHRRMVRRLLWMLPRPTAGMATACRFARAAHAQLASVCRGAAVRRVRQWAGSW